MENKNQFKFHNVPSIKELGGTDWNLLTDPLKTNYGTVPRFFVSDGPSIYPRFLRLIVPARTMVKSGYWHDAACCQALIHNDPHVVAYDRRVADAMLWGFCKAEGNPAWRCLFTWLGVRIGDIFLKFKSEVPKKIERQAILLTANILNCSPEDLFLNRKINVIEPKKL